ncbi:unnamed protein product, partial [Staurois parvus]
KKKTKPSNTHQTKACADLPLLLCTGRWTGDSKTRGGSEKTGLYSLYTKCGGLTGSSLSITSMLYCTRAN